MIFDDVDDSDDMGGDCVLCFVCCYIVVLLSF